MKHPGVGAPQKKIKMDSGWVTEEMWDSPEKEGFMTKYGSSSKDKKTLYFRLQGSSLFFFKNLESVTISFFFSLKKLKYYIRKIVLDTSL